MDKKLNELQEKADALYERDGLTEEVLDLQLKINKLRHENDIVDETEIIDEKWVQ